MEGMLGEIRLFAGNYAPPNWAMCQGQLLQIQQNAALFSILGANYGGDGRNTFALPDLRGRVPAGVNYQQSSQVPTVILGRQQGTPTITLTAANTPAHTHVVYCNDTLGSGNQNTPAGAVPAFGPMNSGTPVNTRFAAAAGTNPVSAMNAQSVQTVGSGTPYSNMMPTTMLNYIICIVGYYPSRN